MCDDCIIFDKHVRMAFVLFIASCVKQKIELNTIPSALEFRTFSFRVQESVP